MFFGNAEFIYRWSVISVWFEGNFWFFLLGWGDFYRCRRGVQQAGRTYDAVASDHRLAGWVRLFFLFYFGTNWRKNLYHQFFFRIRQKSRKADGTRDLANENDFSVRSKR